MLAVIIVMIPLGMILYTIFRRGLAAISWTFLTQPMPYSLRKEGGGLVNAVIGTLMMVGLATLLLDAAGYLGGRLPG